MSDPFAPPYAPFHSRFEHHLWWLALVCLLLLLVLLGLLDG